MIGRDAADPREGMTLGELIAFVQDSQRMNMDPACRLKGRLGWRQQVQRLTVEDPRVDGPAD
jgi:hypothetical protein